MWLQRPAVVGADAESAVLPGSWSLQASPSLLAPFLPSASLLSRLGIQMVAGFFCLFLFFFLHEIFILSSFAPWACGCLLQPPVPAGAGRREGWEEISAAMGQMMQGLSTAHKAMLLVEPDHVSAQGAVSHQATFEGFGCLSPSPVPPKAALLPVCPTLMECPQLVQSCSLASGGPCW